MCVFLCSRVKLPMFRAVVRSTDSEFRPVPASASACGILVAFGFESYIPIDRSGSRIRTVLERITCAAMLRMQTLVCAPERCANCDLLQLPWGCIRCVRWHPPRALLW